MDSKGLALAAAIGFFIGFMITRLGVNNNSQSKSIETKEEINLSGVKKISKHKNYSVVRKINDSTTIFLDSTVWYEDQELD